MTLRLGLASLTAAAVALVGASPAAARFDLKTPGEGYRERVQVIGFGRTWATSDAEVVTCRSRRGGLTCRHPMSGWAFWLGRYRGYRIYRTKRGFPIRVRPLFHTPDAWCGINVAQDSGRGFEIARGGRVRAF